MDRFSQSSASMTAMTRSLSSELKVAHSSMARMAMTRSLSSGLNERKDKDAIFWVQGELWQDRHLLISKQALSASPTFENKEDSGVRAAVLRPRGERQECSPSFGLTECTVSGSPAFGLNESAKMPNNLRPLRVSRGHWFWSQWRCCHGLPHVGLKESVARAPRLLTFVRVSGGSLFFWHPGERPESCSFFSLEESVDTVSSSSGLKESVGMLAHPWPERKCQWAHRSLSSRRALTMLLPFDPKWRDNKVQGRHGHSRYPLASRTAMIWSPSFVLKEDMTCSTSLVLKDSDDMVTILWPQGRHWYGHDPLFSRRALTWSPYVVLVAILWPPQGECCYRRHPLSSRRALIWLPSFGLKA